MCSRAPAWLAVSAAAPAACCCSCCSLHSRHAPCLLTSWAPIHSCGAAADPGRARPSLGVPPQPAARHPGPQERNRLSVRPLRVARRLGRSTRAHYSTRPSSVPRSPPWRKHRLCLHCRRRCSRARREFSILRVAVPQSLAGAGPRAQLRPSRPACAACRPFCCCRTVHLPLSAYPSLTRHPRLHHPPSPRAPRH